MSDNGSLLIKRHKIKNHQSLNPNTIHNLNEKPIQELKNLNTKSVPLTFQKFVSSSSDYNGIYLNSTRTLQPLPELKPKYDRIDEIETNLIRIKNLREVIISRNSNYLLVTNYPLTEKSLIDLDVPVGIQNGTQLSKTSNKKYLKTEIRTCSIDIFLLIQKRQ